MTKHLYFLPLQLEQNQYAYCQPSQLIALDHHGSNKVKEKKKTQRLKENKKAPTKETAIYSNFQTNMQIFLISEFSKVREYKVNIQKVIIFLNTENK